MKNMNRRQVLNLGAGVIAGGLIARSGIAADLPLVDVNDPAAKNVSYVEDADTVDPVKHPQKAGPDGADKRCNNCALYNAVNDDAGSCPLFAGKLVKGAGWCIAWAPKA